MKLWRFIFLIIFFIALYQNSNSLFSDEYDDFVGKIMGNPDSLFVFYCDTNFVNPKFCKDPEIHQHLFQYYKRILIESRSMKLLNSEIKKNDSTFSYSFEYSFPHYNSDITIYFYFEKNRMSKKRKLEMFHIFERMNYYFVDRIIENPDSLYQYLKDTNYIHITLLDRQLWPIDLINDDSIKKLEQCLIRIKKEKLKLIKKDFSYLLEDIELTFDDPKNNSEIKICFYYTEDEKTNKFKIVIFNILYNDR